MKNAKIFRCLGQSIVRFNLLIFMPPNFHIFSFAIKSMILKGITWRHAYKHTCAHMCRYSMLKHAQKVSNSSIFFSVHFVLCCISFWHTHSSYLFNTFTPQNRLNENHVQCCCSVFFSRTPFVRLLGFLFCLLCTY